MIMNVLIKEWNAMELIKSFFEKNEIKNSFWSTDKELISES